MTQKVRSIDASAVGCELRKEVVRRVAVETRISTSHVAARVAHVASERAVLGDDLHLLDPAVGVSLVKDAASGKHHHSVEESRMHVFLLFGRKCVVKIANV